MQPRANSAAASPYRRGLGRRQLRVAKQLKPLRFRAEQASWAESCSAKPEKRARNSVVPPSWITQAVGTTRAPETAFGGSSRSTDATRAADLVAPGKGGCALLAPA